MQCVLSSRGLTACIHTNLQPRYRPHSPRAMGVNTSMLSHSGNMPPLEPSIAVINTPKHHVLRRFGQLASP